MNNKDPVGAALGEIVKIIGIALCRAGLGFKRLRTPGPIIGLLVTVVICALAYISRGWLLGIQEVAGVTFPVPVRFLLYWLLLLTPFFFLVVLGSLEDKTANQYEDIFKEINFMGRDKRYPYFLGKQEDGKKTILTFRSNIPLSIWQKTKDQLETGLDCSIRKISAGANKKTVQLVTVSSDFKIPELINWDDSFMSETDGEVVIGESDLQQLKFNLNRNAHVIAAGETGSGKSVILRAIMWQLLNQGSSAYMIDFKGGVEFGKAYEKYGEVITERDRACEVLEELVRENAARLKLFHDLEVKNLWEYNRKTGSNLCRVVVAIDEIGEMMDKTGVKKEDREVYERLEGYLSTLARLSRATGINLLLGVQRPDAKILPGQIKNNIPVRISGAFQDKAASEIVLGSSAACFLPDIKGRFIYKLGNETVEFQAYYFDDERDLHEIDVEIGDMLTRASTRKQGGYSTQHQPYKGKDKTPERDPWEEPEAAEEDSLAMDFDYEDD